MAELHPDCSLEKLVNVRYDDVEDIDPLLDVLDEPREPEQVEANLIRLVSSKLTDLNTIRHDSTGHIVAMATLNRLPILTGNGSVAWIDDVVTNPAYQGNGLSRVLMDKLEADASSFAPEVLLTSSPERGAARRGYEKRGYLLGADATRQVVYRKMLSAKTVSTADTTDIEQLSADYSNDDIEQIANLLGEDAELVRNNVPNVLESKFTAVFIRRRMGHIAAVAVVNLCPIPIGSKPWIDNLASHDAESRDAVLAAGEHWLLGHDAAPYVNVVGMPNADLPADYEQRKSGLFIKTF